MNYLPGRFIADKGMRFGMFGKGCIKTTQAYSNEIWSIRKHRRISSEPQFEQNTRNLPGKDSYLRNERLESDRLKSFLWIPALAPCADPLALRQLVQWQ